jgi:Mg-chelatase subunit ChlI-like protein
MQATLNGIMDGVIAGKPLAYAALRSSALLGLEPHLVTIEVSCTRGPPLFRMVGLPEAPVREARVRIASALATLGVLLDEYAITINLAPADIPKSGAMFDLALALGVLGALVVFSVARLELVLTGLAIACGVLVYDRWHKGVAWSPVVMGFCRAGLYVLGALAAAGSAGTEVLAPAATLLLYVVGLTHVARFENATAVGRVWPTLFVFAPAIVVLSSALFGSGVLDATLVAVLVVHVGWTLRAVVIALRGGRGAIPRAVVPLIAGISLVDALFVASRAERDYQSLVVAFAAFGLTLLLQRWVRGT